MDITEHNFNEETTILLTIGRMNPPTTGHLLLIKTMLQQALRENLSQINIILSHSQDTKKNPFHCEQKRNLLINDNETIYQSPGQIPGQNQSMITLLKQQMMAEHPEQAPQIEKIAVQIVCMNDNVNPEYGKHPIMKSITYILHDLYGYPREGLTIKLFVGQDRVNDYGWIKKYLETLEPNTNAITMEIVGLPRPEGAMSATQMREYALTNNWEEFKRNMASTGLDEVVVRYMFDEIRANMIIQEPPPKPQPPQKKRKTKGGKRRKTTKRKRKRKTKTKKRKHKK